MDASPTDASPFVRRPRTLPAGVDQAIARGDTLVTAGERAARSLRRAFDEQQHAAGNTLWQPPAILSLASWMAAAWNEVLLAGLDDRIVLNPTQEHALWISVLARDEEAQGLRSVESIAELAAQAWRRLLLADGPLRLEAVAHTGDTRAFARWALEYSRICRRQLALTAAELPGALAGHLRQGSYRPQATGLTLVDIELLLPAQQRLLEAIRSIGIPVFELTTAGEPEAALLAADSLEHEHHALAGWIAERLTQRPDARLTIVVPDLEARRPALERSLVRALEQVGGDATYEFSLGRPLAETAVIATALTLVRWSSRSLPLAEISGLLLSSFFAPGGASVAEFNIAEFDAAELRTAELLRPELSLEQFAQLLEVSPRKSRLGTLPAQIAALRHATQQRAVPRLRTYTEWTVHLRSLLEQCGWAAAARAESLGYQAHGRFEAALDQVATLDFAVGTVPFEEAFAALEHVCRGTIFAAESLDAPIQVLGPLELEPVAPDGLWFLGADDATWPAAQSAHALLPWALQANLKMPGTDPALELARARATTARIAGLSAEVVFSYTRHQEQEERRRSAALSSVRLLPFQAEAPPPAAPLPLDRVPEPEPLQALPDRVLRGGARILEAQSACAFRAFAEHRLHSAPLERAALGLDALDRGNVVHAVLEHFWANVQTRQTLAHLPPAEREYELERSIEAALEQAAARARTGWDTAYLGLEFRRLRQLLLPWLQVELARPDFAVRAREEELKDVAIGPLRLNLRVDRIDETAAGTLILDYKTGHASSAAWCGEQPESPQLPLYAVLSKHAVDGIAFAVLRAGDELDLESMADEAMQVGKRRALEQPGMAEQIAQWKVTLERLASAFAGTAPPTPLPREYPRTCKHCSQRLLCRLDPESLPADDADESEEAAIHG